MRKKDLTVCPMVGGKPAWDRVVAVIETNLLYYGYRTAAWNSG